MTTPKPASAPPADSLPAIVAEMRRLSAGFDNGEVLIEDWADRIEAIAASAQVRAVEALRCSLGVGCDEAGVCYALANGDPDQCGKPAAAEPALVAQVPIHERGMFNIEVLAGDRWQGGMNRGSHNAAIETAKAWAAADGMRYRVFDPDGRLLLDTGDAQDGHADTCHAMHPGDRECNCHKAYGFATAEDMQEADEADRAAARLLPIMPCGHPASLLLKSAETGLPLYCELCDALNRARDGETMEAHWRAKAEAAEASLAACRAELQEMADHGLRFDLNPTHDVSAAEEFWHDYFRRADRSIRERAAATLRQEAT